MAASSSSVHAKQPHTYEVFISFRGDDTRNNFVSHLHAAFKERGIRTYFDEDNLQKGQTIGIQLMKAIKESSIAIVVLSSNYGSSSWCLDELVKIMECKNKFGLVVFPIFYDVDPSDVRKLNLNLQNNFEKLEIWKTTLAQIADIVGEDIRGKNEALIIKEIADKVLKQLPVKVSHFRKSCVGIESRILEIKKLMDSQPEEVMFIGLWGMGGIGKTTTARAIFEEWKDEFEGCCFLQDVKESKNKIENLQMDLLSDILKTRFEGIRDVVTGTNMIRERLQFKRILIVIDDVDNIQQLNVLAKQWDWFGKGSRIIITTRNKHLINDGHIEKYSIHILPQNEALHLFCLHAFKNDHPHEDFKDLSLMVVSYASGLPLALRVLGDHLHQQNRYFWESTLNRLKDVPEDEIITKLQISFDGLTDFQKNIFLDIACFFRGKNTDEVKERLESLGLHPKEGIDVLIQKSLIYISTKYGNHIEMHDLLQEMGWHIVRQKSYGDVTRYSRLWLKKDILEGLSDITVSFETERICLQTDWDLDNDIIKSNLGWKKTFRNMNKLSLLELNGDFFKGNYNVNDSQPFGQLGNKLRWFSWNEYPGKALPKNFHPRNLVQLHMKSSRIKQTPDFSLMPNLEVLKLTYSHKLSHVHSSLGNHSKIKRIHLDECSSLREFPKINQMKSLEILNLSCTNLKSFPEIYGNLDSLRRLNLDGTNITTLKIGRPANLEFLSILDCKYLHTVAISFLGLPHQRIYIMCESLEYFKGNIDDVDGSERMGQLPWTKIHFRYCKRLKELPKSVLSRIEAIVIWECPILASWICFNLVDLLDKYQYLCYLQLHQYSKVVPHEILQAFSERESISNMLRKRETFFKVYIPGSRIPCWLDYQFSQRSVTVLLPPLFRWYTDKLRGFVISGINVDLDNNYDAWFPESSMVMVMYIPIGNILKDIRDWDRQNERTIIEQKTIRYFGNEMVEISPKWGLSLVYSEGEVNNFDPLQVMFVTNDIPNSGHGTFRVKIAGSFQRARTGHERYG